MKRTTDTDTPHGLTERDIRALAGIKETMARRAGTTDDDYENATLEDYL